MSVAHQPRPIVVGQFVGMQAEQGCNLGLDACASSARTVAQNLGQRIGKVPGWVSWKTLVSVTADHSFGGKVGGFEHPHDTLPYPFCRHQLSPIALKLGFGRMSMKKFELELLSLDEASP
jgi:hypothetical protein